MNLKNSLFAIGLLAIATTSYAQKTTKENCGVYDYEQPPTDMALQSFSKYYAEVAAGANANYVSQVQLASKLSGFERVGSKSEVDFKLVYTVYDVTWTPAKYEKKTTTTEKDGVKTTRHTHYYTGTYTYRVDVEIVLADGSSIFNASEGRTKQLMKSSMVSASDARSQYDNAVKRLKPKIVPDAVRALEKTISDKYCYVNSSIKCKAIKVKPKKFDYDAFNKGVDDLKTAVESGDVSGYSEMIQSAIAAWENDLKESDLESKKSRINKSVTAGANYNIGIAYFLLNDFEKAEEYLNKAMEIDKNVTAMHRIFLDRAVDMQARAENLR